MAWFVLARGLFAAAVIYMSVLLHPLNAAASVNAGFGVALALLIILAETRLRETSVTHLLGALIGGAI
jgi:hypothetical protein